MQPLEYFLPPWVVCLAVSHTCLAVAYALAAMPILIETIEIKHCALLEATLDAMRD